MAITETKISELPDAGPLDGTEYLPVVQGGATKKTTTSQLGGGSGGGGGGVTHVTFYAGSNYLVIQPNGSPQYIDNNLSYRTIVDTSQMAYVRVLANVYKTNSAPNDPRLYPQYSTDGGSTWVTVGAGTVASGDAVPLQFGMQASNWIAIPAAAQGQNIGWRIAQDGGDTSDNAWIGLTALEFKA